MNFNIVNRQPVTREMLVNRGHYIDDPIPTEEDRNEIVAADCLVCGWFSFTRLDERCICEGKECPHFDSPHYHLESK